MERFLESSWDFPRKTVVSHMFCCSVATNLQVWCQGARLPGKVHRQHACGWNGMVGETTQMMNIHRSSQKTSQMCFLTKNTLKKKHDINKVMPALLASCFLGLQQFKSLVSTDAAHDIRHYMALFAKGCGDCCSATATGKSNYTCASPQETYKFFAVIQASICPTSESLLSGSDHCVF